VAALLLLAGPAPAAPYTVWSCQGPAGEALPGTAWTGSAAGDGAATSTDCAAGLRAALPAGAANVRSSATLSFSAPVGTRITAYELARTLRASVGGFFSAGYVANVSSVDPVGQLGAGCAGSGLTFPSVCTVGDPPLAASGVSVQGLALTAACAQDGCPSQSPAAEAVLARSRVVIEDPQAPVVTGTSGTLTTTDRVARAVTVGASDVGGGVAAISATVDGGSAVGVPSGGPCAVPFWAPQPCPSTRETTFSVDTGALAPGDHVATGSVSDAAGNATAWGPVPFAVPAGGGSDGGAAPSGSVAVPVPGSTPDGAPAAPTARLTLTGTTTKSGRRRPKGELRTRGGTPMAGVTVRLTRTRSGAENPRTVALKPVRTGQDGRFVAAALPEGAWTVAAAADTSSGTVTASARLRTALRTTAVPSPTRLRTGALMVLSGRLTGAGPARSGVRVRIQTIVKGRYRTVAAVRTTSSGSWRWRHRFTKVSRPTLFSFRAVVPGEGADWPWSPISRRARSVLVNPR
jgi:hypothetical protein